jgi:ectoine hydroxylase-related dioxygenase (phytanoyl-CoA dioxygenase family)
MEENGYIIIRDAIKYPSLKLRRLLKDPRAHSNTMWNLRFEVKKHYEKIWNTKELVSCFGGNNTDAPSFSLPWHVDQNRTHGNNMRCVQGILALTKSDSTQLLSGSHKYFKSMSYRCTSNNPYEWESYEISEKDYIWKKGLKIVTPKLNPGDLLIFDSRLVHRVIETTPRTVVYISMVPRRFLSNLIERLRKKAYKRNIITTHWCEKVIQQGQDSPIQKNLKYNSLI